MLNERAPQNWSLSYIFPRSDRKFYLTVSLKTQQSILRITVLNVNQKAVTIKLSAFENIKDWQMSYWVR